MLNRLTYKQKNLLLIAGALIFGFLVYKKALKNTFGLMADCEKLEAQLALADVAPQEVAALRTELQQLNTIVGPEGSTTQAHQLLLEQVSEYCKSNNMHVASFPEPSAFEAEEFTIVTGTAEIEGGLHDLVKLVHELEQRPKGFKVASVRFYTQTNVQSKKTKLYARIYFQNVRQA